MKRKIPQIINDAALDRANEFMGDTTERKSSQGYYLRKNFQNMAVKLERDRVFKGSIYKILSREPGIAPGQYEYERELITPMGSAQIIHDYGDDFPVVNFETRSDKGVIVDIGNAIEYSRKDLRVAAYRGRPLVADKMWAAAIAQEQTINELSFWGRPKLGIEGLFSRGNYIPRLVMTHKLEKSTNAEDIYDQFVYFVEMAESDAILANVFSNAPDTLLLDRKSLSFLNSTPRFSGGTDTKSIKAYLLENTSLTSIEAIPECSEKMPKNNGKRIAFAYPSGDSTVATLVAPEIFVPLPVHIQRAKFELPFISKVGGVYVKNPMAMAIAELEVP